MSNKPIPRFKTEDEEGEYWSTHSGADFVKEENIVKMDFSKLKPTTQSIILRVPQVTKS